MSFSFLCLIQNMSNFRDYQTIAAISVKGHQVHRSETCGRRVIPCFPGRNNRLTGKGPPPPETGTITPVSSLPRSAWYGREFTRYERSRLGKRKGDNQIMNELRKSKQNPASVHKQITSRELFPSQMPEPCPDPASRGKAQRKESERWRGFSFFRLEKVFNGLISGIRRSAIVISVASHVGYLFFSFATRFIPVRGFWTALAFILFHLRGM